MQLREAGPERRPAAGAVQRLDRPVMSVEADRNLGLDDRPDLGQIIGKLAGGQARPHGRHTAADVHADRGRADRLLHGNDRANRRALAVVHVGHDGHLLRPGQRRHVTELLQRGRVDRPRIGPHLHGRPRAGQKFVSHRPSPVTDSCVCVESLTGTAEKFAWTAGIEPVDVNENRPPGASLRAASGQCLGTYPEASLAARVIRGCGDAGMPTFLSPCSRRLPDQRFT